MMRRPGFIRYFLILCLLASGISLLLVFTWNRSSLGQSVFDVSSRRQPSTDDPIFVFIYSKYRTGSTFTSDIFKRHQNISYVFEPLNLRKPSNRKNLAVLWDHFKCNLVDSKNLHHVHPRWLHQDSFCRMPQQSPGCKPGGWGTKLELSEFLPIVETHCRRSAVRVIKEIRIHDIRDVTSLPFSDVKIIHLIRDPRGVVNSRDTKKRYKDVDIYDVAEHYCTGALRDLQSMMTISQMHPSVASQYYIVRYEDLASRNIQAEMNEMYSFIGIKPDPSLREWAQQVAINSTQSERGAIHRKKGYYGVDRPNPEATARSWRQRMSFERTRIIQDACDQFLDVFRYKKFGTSEAYTDPDLPIVLPFERDGLFQRLVDVTLLYAS